MMEERERKKVKEKKMGTLFTAEAKDERGGGRWRWRWRWKAFYSTNKLKKK